jgi:hypothetical protein
MLALPASSKRRAAPANRPVTAHFNFDESWTALAELRSDSEKANQFMRKTTCTPEELNTLLTAELRRVPGCEGAAWVRVYRLRKHVRGKNWLAAFLAAGSADKRDCARALIEIERRLQAEFDLAPERFKRERSRPFLGYRRHHRRLPSQLLPQSALPRAAVAGRAASAIIRALFSRRRKKPSSPKMVRLISLGLRGAQ